LNRSNNNHENNKENQANNNAAEATPARPGHVSFIPIEMLKKPENPNDSKGRKNLALQLSQVKNEIDRSHSKLAASSSSRD